MTPPMSRKLERVRNFCIIAHIDHGKSTLADRLLELTGTISTREMKDQVLDAMDLEREKGITIKSHPVTMYYRAPDGETYELNLIDTPGHVDFSYEVSRSMSACEGALLLVDAAQGVEAQTVANCYLALEHNLEILPVLNKVDLPSAKPDEVARQVEEILSLPMADAPRISAKTGLNVQAVLQAVLARVPPPRTTEGAPLRALIFDSSYDAYRGVVPYVRIMDGVIRPGDRIRLMGTGVETEVKEVGLFRPRAMPCAALEPGQVGYVIGTLKEAGDVRIGDTITHAARPAREPLPGFREVRPMVFSGIYPVDTADLEKLKASLEKLKLNDSALTFQPETSVALGFGFRCGFLGLLHLEIVQERLRREFDMDIISTYPAVMYRVHLKNGEVKEIHNPLHMPEPNQIEHIEEPMIRAFIICPNEQVGDICRLVRERRGTVERTDSLDARRLMLTGKLPLNEILVDFHDALKNVTHGYGSMDYENCGYEPSDLVKLDILLNGEPVDAFSAIVHRDKAVARGRQMCAALKEVIPPHQFAVPIQAAIGRTIIARETIRALRKDVTAKCYGGDVTRKRKLLERQKEGKKRMKQFGQVHVPQEAFVSVLKSSP